MKRQAEENRARLAERAAMLRLTGGDTRLIYPILRRLTTAELLARPVWRGGRIELNGEIESLCAAALCTVYRRGDWLDFCPADRALHTGAERKLLHAAVLCFLRDALHSHGAALICCRRANNAALLFLRSGSRYDTNSRGDTAETTALLRRLAQACGGTAVFAAAGAFSAVLRLPLLPCLPAAAAAYSTEELVTDRYSLLYIYLYRYCAWPDE